MITTYALWQVFLMFTSGLLAIQNICPHLEIRRVGGSMRIVGYGHDAKRIPMRARLSAVMVGILACTRLFDPSIVDWNMTIERYLVTGLFVSVCMFCIHGVAYPRVWVRIGAHSRREDVPTGDRSLLGLRPSERTDDGGDRKGHSVLCARILRTRIEYASVFLLAAIAALMIGTA